MTEFSAGISAGGRPYAITAGPDGNLWFVEFGGSRVGRITTTGVITEFSAGITPGSLSDITRGPDGNLWFTAASGRRISRITPQGVVTEFSAGISAGASLGNITAGPDGNLWFTENGGSTVGRITTTGVVTEFPTGIGANTSSDIAAGPDGNLWFTAGDFGGRIGRITPTGAVTNFRAGASGTLGGIAAGPDGNLWFTEGAGRIGRITPAGAVNEFSAGITPGSSPAGITAGPDGNLWFTEATGNRIGRITTDVPPIRPPSPPPFPKPVLGRSVNAAVVRGEVLVSLPAGAARTSATVPGLKGRTFVPLSAARQIPVGSLLDTRKGTVRLTSARNLAGATQSGEFLSGVFQVLQSRSAKAQGLTELRLKGSSFRRCRLTRRRARGRGRFKTPTQRGAQAEAARRSRRTIRRLRGNASGRFSTRGRYSAATVRGTDWTVSDRCDGTLTKVKRGKVAVRDFRRKKTIIVRAGKRYLARPRS